MKTSTRPDRGSSRIRALVASIMLVLMSVAVACEDDEGPLGLDDDVATVEITTAPQTLEIGTTSQLAFEIRDADGDIIDPADVTIDFTSSTETVATVSETGLVTPVAVGTTTVTIEAGGITDTITIDVIAEITSIDIVESEVDVITDETLVLDFTVLDAAGQPVVDPSLSFTSSNPSIVSVDDEGNLTGEGEGTATITVSGGGASDTIEVTVFSAASGGISLGGASFTAQTGDAVDISELVVVRDAGGVIIPDADLAFTTTDAAVASVDAAGMLTSLAVGTTLITVTSPDAAGSATFRLTVLEAGSVEAIEVDPATVTVSVDATVDLAIAAEADGDPITDFLGVFTSSDETVAVVDPFTGVVTGIAPGVATITVVNGDLTSDAEITVE
jgi:uncharacterized protein YjdB